MLFYSCTPKISFNLILLTICYKTLVIFFVPCLWQDKKKISLYFFTAYHLSYFYLQTLYYQHCWSQQYAGHVSHELCNRPGSPWSLCGSEVEHQSTESEDLRFDSSWGLRIFFLCPTLVTRQKKTSFSNSFDVSLESLVVDQLITPKLIFAFILLTCLLETELIM